MMFHAVIRPNDVVADDDVMRALGHLSLQMAVLEDAVDECAAELELEVPCMGFTDRKLVAKIGYCKREAQVLAAALPGLQELPGVLIHAAAVAELANDSVNETIYGGPGVERMLATGDTGVEHEAVGAADIYALAKDVAAVACTLMQLATVSIPRARLAQSSAA